MDELSDKFARDLGLRPQGKSAPMSASKTEAAGLREGSYSAGSSWSTARSGLNPTSTNDPFVSYSGAGISDDYVFVGVLESSNSSSRGRSATFSSPTSLDAIFDGLADSITKTSSALPVFDKPVYDDDIFDGAPGLKNSSSAKHEDVFSSIVSGSGHVSTPPFVDLLQNFQKQMPESKGRSDGRSLEREEQNISEFDELISGFGRNSPLKDREVPEAKHQKTGASAATPVTNKAEDPFVVLESISTSTYPSSGLFSDPLENIGRTVSSKGMHSTSKRIIADSNALDGTSKSVTSSSDEIDERHRERSSSDDFQTKSSSYDELGKEPPHQSFTNVFDNIMPKVEVRKFDDLHNPTGRSGPHTDPQERNTTGDQAPKIYKHTETRDDVWLTVSEVPLRTQPTNAPPPSRPPPPLVVKYARFNVDAKTNDNEPLQQFTHSHPYGRSSIKRFPLDNFEDFAMSKSKAYVMHNEDIFSSVEFKKKNSAAAAMKDRSEAKFQLGEEVMEREYDTIFSRNHEYAQVRNEKINFEGKDLEGTERVERLDQERLQKEREDREEAKRLEKEREQELEKEREKARQVAERAIREARERAAAEARQKAEKAAAEARQRAERAAVQRAAAEARERAAALARERAEKAAAEVREKAVIEAREKASLEARERAATEARERAAAEARERAAAEAREKATAETRERAAAEARERAAAEARERAEKAAAEAREKVNVARERAAVERAAAEARQRAQRAAVERAAAEARERAAAAAREKAAAAAAAREEHKEENDLESFFGMGSRATSAPKQRSTSSETMFEVKVQNRGNFDGPLRTASGSSSTVRKASSSANIVDDLSSIFGAPPASGEFQDIEGESEERRRARLERHQRTQERAAKALAEKNERDLQIQKEQAERHRIAETLDVEIKRWAAGKEGNLRTLLSTLQYVLWPECGWQPVSLTDLITGAAVKRVYRKATLCIHPDKVQQKGATLQQKYIAEKVFDLLKEAWNKFNSEELF